MEPESVLSFFKDQGVTIEALTKNCQLEQLEEVLFQTMEDYRGWNRERTLYANRDMSACVDLPQEISSLVAWATNMLVQPHTVFIRALEYVRRYLFARYLQLKKLHGTVSRTQVVNDSKANPWIIRCIICVGIAAKWNCIWGTIHLPQMQSALKSSGEVITNKELVDMESRVLETLEFKLGFPTLTEYTGILMALLSIRFHRTSSSTHKTFIDNSIRISAMSKNLIILYSLDTQTFFENVFSVFTVPLPPGDADRSSWLDIQNNELLVAACSILGAVKVIEIEDLFDPVLTELSAFIDMPSPDIEIVTPVLVDLLHTGSQPATSRGSSHT